MDKKIEGISNIAIELGMQQQHHNLSGLLRLVGAPMRINNKRVAVYSLTKKQVKLIGGLIETLKKEMLTINI